MQWDAGKNAGFSDGTPWMAVNPNYETVNAEDALDMGAISSHYEKTEACRMALEAGCDMLLICGEFKSAYEGILAQVKSGTIAESRIDESVLRILRVKETLGLP